MLNKNFRQNVLFLYLVQFSNYILPFVWIPIIINKVGISSYGSIAIVQSVTLYFQMLIDYSFNYKGSKDISINNKNTVKIQKIYNQVLSTKLAISVLVILSILILYTIFDYQIIYYFIIFIPFILGHALTSYWFFQGQSDMKYISILTIMNKVLVLLSIIILLKPESSIVSVLLCISIPNLIMGLLSHFIILVKYRLSFKFDFNGVITELKEGFDLFIGYAGSSLYLSSNVIILGIFQPHSVVAIYSIVEKIIVAVQKLSSPFLFTLYPEVSKIANESVVKLLVFKKRLIKIAFIFSSIVSIGLAICTIVGFKMKILSDVTGINGDENLKSFLITMLIMCMIPIVGTINSVLCTQTLVPLNEGNYFKKITVLTGIFSIALSFLIVPFYGILATASTYVISELFLFLLVSIRIKQLETANSLLNG